MIVYFSGTGNSRLIAESLATRLHTESMWLFDAVNIHGNIEGLVFPVYSWGVPPVILDFINRVDLHRLRNGIWCVMTCGDEVAKAPEMLMNALLSKEIEMKGIWSVTMPNNYVLLPGFDTDSKELERKKLDAVAKRVEEIARKIKAGDKEIDVVRGSIPWIKTKLVFPLFKKYGTRFSRWHADDRCISCGLCVSVCPVSNIRMKGDRPKWGDDCISCVACYHICPANAISYGKYTKGKHQYNTLLRKR